MQIYGWLCRGVRGVYWLPLGSTALFELVCDYISFHPYIYLYIYTIANKGAEHAAEVLGRPSTARLAPAFGPTSKAWGKRPRQE